MDTMQPWNKMGQGYRTGQGYFQQRPFNRAQPPGHTQPGPAMPDTTQQMEWLSGLSRDEKIEAKRLALQANFSFEGYQVVRREFISHQFDPAMTIRGASITFNNSCISRLEDAYTEDTNLPSQHLCERLGMRREGLFMEFVSFVNQSDGTPLYENTVQYAILKKEWEERKCSS